MPSQIVKAPAGNPSGPYQYIAPDTTMGAAEGANQGAGTAAYLKALGIPNLGALFGAGSSSSGTSVASGSSTPPPIAPPSLQGLQSAASSVPPVAAVAPADPTAANAAIFARAKDQVGQTGSAALAGLRSALGGRNLLGSGSETKGLMGVANAGQQQLGDVSREQAVSDVGTSNEFAKTNQAAAITQRSQDIGAAESAAQRSLSAATTGYEGALTQREQDIQAQQAKDTLAFNTATEQARQRQASLQGLLAALGPASRTY